MLRFLAALVVATACTTGTASAVGLHEYTGTIHGHTSYSDGYPGSTPRSVYAQARGHGNDFFALTDHSDSLDLPLSVSQYCAPPAPQDVAACALADGADSFRKWPATLEQALAASTPTFTAVRGFEWTSDRFGHVNVLFSQNQVNAKVDGGYASLQTFYSWLGRAPGLAGGADGLAIFNHPGDKKLDENDPAYNWNDFAHDPAVDDQFVGIEVFNSRSDFGSPRMHGAGDDGWYAHALDAGWHVGAVGAEDLGHDRGDDWGGPNEAKTVLAAVDRSTPSLKGALKARRTYAVARPGLGLSYELDGAPMGSRLQRTTGRELRVRATATGAVPAGRHLEADLVTSGGRVVATAADGRLDVARPASPEEDWYFVRVREVGPGVDRAVAFSSPVWVTAAAAGAAPAGEWLAGDFHAHTCFSRDVYCGPSDEPLEYEPAEGAQQLADDLAAADLQAAGTNLATGLADDVAQVATYGLDVGGRFLEASVRGLDFLAVTDHEDVRSSGDPAFSSSGVLGVPAYENSIAGHAQMLGATRVLDNANVSRMAAELRADGGLLQANHPAYRIEDPFTRCDDPTQRHWKYGPELALDTVEVWNPTSSIAGGEAFLECRLQLGEHVAATGGGDSHWATLTAAGAGVGSPSTWVFSRDRSVTGVLDAVRRGRTSISKSSPLQGGDALVLEADANGDGTYEAFQGATVPGGTALRLRAVRGTLAGVAKVRANGRTLTLANPALVPGGTVDFTAPAEAGWVRADLLAVPVAVGDSAPCPVPGQSISLCSYDQLMLAMTSPLYLTARGGGTGATGSTGATGTTGATGSTGADAAGGTAAGNGGTGGSAGGNGGTGADSAGGNGGTGGTTGGGITSPPAEVPGPAGRLPAATPRGRSFRSALRLRSGQTARRVRGRGLRVQIGCDLACRTTILVTRGDGRRIHRVVARLPRPGRRELTLRLPRGTRGTLRIATSARSTDGQVRTHRLRTTLR